MSTEIERAAGKIVAELNAAIYPNQLSLAAENRLLDALLEFATAIKPSAPHPAPAVHPTPDNRA